MIGSVKINIHSGEEFYNDLTFSDVHVVKLLIQYRDKYDEYYRLSHKNHYNYAGTVKRLNRELINTYVCLDDLIEKCKFNNEQSTIIAMIQVGYTYQEIADYLKKQSGESIKNRLNKICRDIVKMNYWLWRKCVYVDKLELKTKICSKCKEELPATDEFFSPDERNLDGFHSFCKNCR
jgi:hypothetical protein